MSGYQGYSFWVAQVAQPDVPIAVDAETLVAQGGVAVATLLSLSLLCFSLTRLVKAIRAD